MMEPYIPAITFILGAAGGWLSRRWWFRFEKRMALRAHLSGWKSEIENINPTRPDSAIRIWSVYRAGVPDLQRLACLGDFSGRAAEAIYRLNHIPNEEITESEGDKRVVVCTAINNTLEATK